MNKKEYTVIDTSYLHSITKNRLMDLDLLLNNRLVKQDLIYCLQKNIYKLRESYYKESQLQPGNTALFNKIPFQGGGSEELATIYKYLNSDIYNTKIRYRGGRRKINSKASPILWDFEENMYREDLTNLTAETVSLYVKPKEKFDLYLGNKKSFYFYDAAETAKNAINLIQTSIRNANLS